MSDNKEKIVIDDNQQAAAAIKKIAEATSDNYLLQVADKVGALKKEDKVSAAKILCGSLTHSERGAYYDDDDFDNRGTKNPGVIFPEELPSHALNELADALDRYKLKIAEAHRKEVAKVTDPLDMLFSPPASDEEDKASTKSGRGK